MIPIACPTRSRRVTTRCHWPPTSSANRFEGTVTIAITVHQPVSEIVLNAAELEIRSAVLHSARGEQAGTVTLDAELERATVALSNRLTPGDATLVVALYRHDQRRVARLLSKRVQRRRWAGESHRHYAIRVDRRPQGVPVLGRAGA